MLTIQKFAKAVEFVQKSDGFVCFNPPIEKQLDNWKFETYPNFFDLYFDVDVSNGLGQAISPRYYRIR